MTIQIPSDNFIKIQFVGGHQVLVMILDNKDCFALVEYVTIDGKLYTRASKSKKAERVIEAMKSYTQEKAKNFISETKKALREEKEVA